MDKEQNIVDDTLDVFATHGLGGICGMILTAIFAKDVGLINGQHETLILHLIACLVVIIFVLIGSYLIYKLVDVLLPISKR